jgi:hypothetical protein
MTALLFSLKSSFCQNGGSKVTAGITERGLARQATNRARQTQSAQGARLAKYNNSASPLPAGRIPVWIQRRNEAAARTEQAGQQAGTSGGTSAAFE